MKNSNYIIINGFTRGGTNILWNILQSHPAICSPIRETGEILFGTVFPRYAPVKIMAFLRGIIINKYLNNIFIGKIVRKSIDFVFYKRKLENYGFDQDGYKFENINYSYDEICQTSICLKSIDWDIVFTDWFNKYFDEPKFIGLIRNGYAVCNGWIRRGKSAEEAGKAYFEIGKMMINYSKNTENYKLIKFENLLSDPFNIADQLYNYVEVEPVRLEKLRLKSKKVVYSDGKHESQFGSVDKKYWFDKKQINKFFVKDIDKTQRKLLAEKDRITFEKYAMPVLQYFDYYK